MRSQDQLSLQQKTLEEAAYRNGQAASLYQAEVARSSIRASYAPAIPLLGPAEEAARMEALERSEALAWK